MIRNKNIDPNAGIAWSKIQGPGQIGETYWLTGKTDNAYALLQKNTSESKIHFSIMDAIGAMTANQGDKLYVTPGYTETITGAGGITIAKAGIEIIGLGNYYNMPTFLMDDAAVSALVTAADVGIHNLVFNPGHEDLAYCFLISGKGCTLGHNRFFETTTNENWVDVIRAGSVDNDFDGLTLIGNEIVLTDAAHVTAIELMKDCKDVKILGNKMVGDFDGTPYAPLYMAPAEVPTNLLVKDNFIHNQHDGNAAVGISIACTTATGWIINNHVGHQDAADGTPILAGAAGLYCGENYVSSVLGTASGYLYPAADDGA